MMTLIRRIAEWGIRSDTPYEQAHHLRLTNVVLLFLCFGSVVQTLACFATGAIDAGLFNCTAPVAFAGALWLMKSGHTLAARLFIVTVCYAGTYVFIAALGPQSYFQIMFLFASALSFVLFSLDEKAALAYGLFTPLVLFIVLEMNNYEPLFGMKRAEHTPGQILVLRCVSLSLVWVVMTAHFVYSARDRKRSQEKLVASAKMAAIGNMAAGIAHEINNPLQVIVSYADRMKRLLKTDMTSEAFLESTEKIQAVALRIGTITKGLLSLSRDVSEDPFEKVSVKDIVQFSLSYSRAHLDSHRVQIEFNPILDDCWVMGRETQLTEVLINVLNNAYSAVLQNPEGQPKKVRVETIVTNKLIEIAVTDSGPGVNPKLSDRIFDPFYTTKPLGHGTGLGLSISRSIMAAHHGEIRYESIDKGARFVLSLPRAVET